MNVNKSFDTLWLGKEFNQFFIKYMFTIILIVIAINIIVKGVKIQSEFILSLVNLLVYLCLPVVIDGLSIFLIFFLDYKNKTFTSQIQYSMSVPTLLVGALAVIDLVIKIMTFFDERKEENEKITANIKNERLENSVLRYKEEVNQKIQELTNKVKILEDYYNTEKVAKKEDKNVVQTTLLIMVAGIGSRFGGGIKQLEPVDENGHIIMDYSIHDAIEAGFNKVVFIIRKDIEEEFKEVIGDRIESICAKHQVTVDYAFQDINEMPGELPEGRMKLWGTGQAVLAAKDMLTTPFIVINADDYYGKEGFRAVHEYLVGGGASCMAGFVLKNTLSDNGGVTRGICKMDDQNNLTEVVETKNIVKTTDGAEVDGNIIDTESLVSMNMWGLTPEFLPVLEHGFEEFFEKEVPANPMKAEYLIPTFIGELLEQGKMSVKVLRSNDTWYGMTYKEDVAAVRESFEKMLEQGIYRKDLFADL